MKNIKIFDSTLRDGSHAIKHQITEKNIEQYCQNADNVGFYTVIVGHGNGLGASSLQVGISKIKDNDMLKIARKNLTSTKLGVFMIPGFGTIKDNLVPALDNGVDLFCIASHCTEADVTQQHIRYLKERGKEVYGVLMMYHMASLPRLVQEAQKMESYGVSGIIIMDSAGASTPEMVSSTITTLTEKLNIDVGFHGHNNLGLAISNSYLALECGANIIDGTVRGFGAGAGNCQLEVLVGLLYDLGIKTSIDLYRAMDLSEDIVSKIMLKPQEITSTSLISGIAGVFSGFLEPVKFAAKKFNIDARDIFMELGKRKVVGGQEDIILEVADELVKRKTKNETNYQIESLS